MIDDTSDTSNNEQSAVSVRLINNGEVEEHLFGLIDASEDQSADGLTEMLKTLQKYRLVPETSGEKLIGQSYDGAAAMSGELNGVQRQVQSHFQQHITTTVLRTEWPYVPLGLQVRLK